MRSGLLLALAFCYAGAAAAQNPQYMHQISFGSDFDFGWGGSAATADTDDNIDEFNLFENDFNITYLYSMSPRIQLGVDLTSESDSVEIEYDTGGDSDASTDRTGFYFLANYNFHEDFKNAWYAGIGFGKEYVTEEVGNNESEYDLDAFQIFAGKRFHLDDYGVSNLVYSPSLSLTMASVNGDLEDQGVNSLRRLSWNFIKFDLLW